MRYDNMNAERGAADEITAEAQLGPAGVTGQANIG
jgi:hypothetical protein